MLINIFKWFFKTTYSQTKVILFSDNVGNALERLKNEVSWNYKVSEMENYMMNKDFALVLELTCTCIYIYGYSVFQYVCDWLDEVAKTHFEVIVSCLLPHPAEYARVGGFWSVSSAYSPLF